MTGTNGAEAVGHGPAALLARTAELAAAERPFALATVVAIQRPTSARPGARGIIHPDGAIEGWVGGSCAQPIVVREALRSLADGQPRLLRLSRTPPSDARRGDGIIEYVMTCHSGGTLEIYVEPHLPAPALWVAGTTPIAGALVELAAASGYRVTLVDPIADAEAFPAAERVVQSDDLAGLDPGTAPYVVVATQGQWDEEAIAGILRRECSYIGLVASPTRAAAVRSYLLDDEQLPGDRVAALRAPAGLDLGADTPEEIALSILAELVQVRRGRAAFVASPGPAAAATAAASEAVRTAPAAPGAAGAGSGTRASEGSASKGSAAAGAGAATHAAAAPEGGEGGPGGEIVLKDPVCGMTVDEDRVRHIAEYGGIVYAFCCVGCRSRFVKDPTAYVPASAGATAG